MAITAPDRHPARYNHMDEAWERRPEEMQSWTQLIALKSRAIFYNPLWISQSIYIFLHLI
jgi:hypothetical protein